jgi:glycerophosphoryl diester phosphodiesterase
VQSHSAARKEQPANRLRNQLHGLVGCLALSCASSSVSPVETFPPALRVLARAAQSSATLSRGQFTELLALPDGGLLGLGAGGLEAAEHLGEALLQVYALTTDLETGRLEATAKFSLSDPHQHLGWPIARHFTAERGLTHADLELKSMVQAPDGTFWFGDAQGPFLVHTDARGVVLEAPYPLSLEGQVLRGPGHPARRANLMLRTMQALRVDARLHDAGAPWASMDHRWLEHPDQVAQLHAAGFRVLPWTVNEPARMAELLDAGVDGLITDRPDLVAAFHRQVDIQGHRGARGLKPESTLAAFLAGLDAGATTLELDLTATADDEPVVWHDAALGPPACRGTPDGGLVLPFTHLAQLAPVQCDGRSPRFPLQTAGGDTHVLRLSEVAALGTPLNVETKVHGTGAPHDDAAWLTRWLGSHAPPAVTLQSFDWRSLRVAHAEFPWLQTVALFGDSNAADGARAGLPWPQLTNAESGRGRSASLKGLVLSADGRTLYVLLETPEHDQRERLTLAFDLQQTRFVGRARPIGQ